MRRRGWTNGRVFHRSRVMFIVQPGGTLPDQCGALARPPRAQHRCIPPLPDFLVPSCFSVPLVSTREIPVFLQLGRLSWSLVLVVD
ncbi:hypothetical protein ACOMHN_018085 [Nucella lapillus]